MKKIILLTLFVYSIINVHAQIDLTKIEREYLPEIQVDSAFFRMLDSILTDELKESRNRNDFNYDVLLLLDQHGNHCAQIAPAGVRVPNVVGEKDTYSIWGIMDYNDHSFLFRGVYIDEVIDISVCLPATLLPSIIAVTSPRVRVLPSIAREE